MNQTDPGLQPQRTSLAWYRTGFAVFINALIVLRIASSSHQKYLYWVGLLLLFASIMVAIWGLDRIATLNNSLVAIRPPRFLMATITITTLIAAVAGLLCTIAE